MSSKATQVVSKRNLTDIQVDLALMFDTNEKNLYLVTGEEVIDVLADIEDTKGNNGMLGQLFVTNLRLIWSSKSDVNANLSMGLNTIAYLTVKMAQSKLRGTTQSLYIGCKMQENRYEFVFTNINPDENSRVFTTVNSVYKAYRTSRLYREVQLRGNFIHDKKLELLPNETLEEVIMGVWHLAGEQGTLGTAHLTNIRMVWTAAMEDNVNISMPYVQLASLILKDTKYGRALVVESSPSSGHYLLGFRIDPQERVEELFHRLEAKLLACDEHPYFGIEIVEQEQAIPNSTSTDSHATFASDTANGKHKFISTWRQQDDINIIDERSTYLQSITPSTSASASNQPQQQQRIDVKSLYSTQPLQSAQVGDQVFVYDEHLGLAVEKINDPSIQSIEQLWSLLI